MAKLFPHTAEQLIEHMERLYPEPVFKPGTPPDVMSFQSGQRSVVRQMRDAFDLTTRRKEP